MRRVFPAIAALIIATALAGCSGAALPTFDEVRDETHLEMQRIVDRLPAGSVVRVEDPLPDSSYSCEGGRKYTGQWEVYVAEGFEIQPWLEEVEGDLIEDGYVAVDSGPSLTRSFSLWTPETQLLVGVINVDDAEEGPRVEVSGYSRCAQDPFADE